MLKSLVAIVEAASDNCTLNAYAPSAVGVPDIWPVDAFRARPGGRLPDIMDHV